MEGKHLTMQILHVFFLLLQSASGAFTVTNGSCTASWSCARSPNFPQRYENDQGCTLTVAITGFVIDTSFVTEQTTDVLNLRRRGRAYSGRRRSTEQVDSVFLTAGSPIVWSADETLVYSGWEICLSPVANHTRRRAVRAIHTSLTIEASSGSNSECGGCSHEDTNIGNSYSTSSCQLYYGSCHWMQKEVSACWSTNSDMCAASDVNQCCENDSIVMGGLLFAILLAIAAVVFAICYCCSGCPVYKHCHRDEQPPVVLMMPGIPMTVTNQHVGSVQHPVYAQQFTMQDLSPNGQPGNAQQQPQQMGPPAYSPTTPPPPPPPVSKSE